ncbi:MAG: hypothetical protein RSB50_06875 [Cetobacterium sp.]
MGKKMELKGLRFGRLLVIEEGGRQKNGGILWSCECECGATTLVKRENLLSGNTKSCGCLRISNPTKHGESRNRIYIIANGILQRCNNPNHKWYSIYGGRGIKCLLGNTTAEVYENLLKIPGYKNGLSIDRINVDGNYELYNLRWADASLQAFNKRISSRNTSGQRGVSFSKSSKKWRAEIKKDKKLFYKTFNTKEEAISYRLKLEKELQVGDENVY